MRVWGVAFVGVLLCNIGCTFNFDLTSNRTAIENQMMGSYQEISDELILMSTMRGDSRSQKNVESAVEARRNQEFNRDDIEELKDKGLLGEGRDGRLTLLGEKNREENTTFEDRNLARQLMHEENRDRFEIWKYLLARHKSLKADDLPEVSRAYGLMQRKRLREGQWYQNEEGVWVKVAPNSTRSP